MVNNKKFGDWYIAVHTNTSNALLLQALRFVSTTADKLRRNSVVCNISEVEMEVLDFQKINQWLRIRLQVLQPAAEHVFWNRQPGSNRAREQVLYK